MRLLGTILQEPIEGIPTPNVSNDVPDTFDARQKWGSKIHEIRN